MKIMSLIFAIYLLGAAVVPCCIYDDCSADEMSANNSPGKNEKDSGMCSPFFNCGSCSHVSIDPVVIEQRETMPVAILFYDSWTGTLTSSPGFDIWQPPRNFAV
jgi:hypothetical protein